MGKCQGDLGTRSCGTRPPRRWAVAWPPWHVAVCMPLYTPVSSAQGLLCAWNGPGSPVEVSAMATAASTSSAFQRGFGLEGMHTAQAAQAGSPPRGSGEGTHSRVRSGDFHFSRAALVFWPQAKWNLLGTHVGVLPTQDIWLHKQLQSTDNVCSLLRGTKMRTRMHIRGKRPLRKRQMRGLFQAEVANHSTSLA